MPVIKNSVTNDCILLKFKFSMLKLKFYGKEVDYLRRFPRINAVHAWKKKRGITNSILNHISYKKILDIGCANGDQLKSYIRIKKDIFGFGIDISLKNIKIAKNNCQSAIFLCGDGQNLPLKNETFDVVVATEVIEHIQNHKRFLKEIHRVLKSRGYLILSTPNKLQISSLFNEIIKSTTKKNLNIPGHISMVTPMKLIKELKEAGFLVESIKFGSLNPYIFPPYFLIFREIKFINTIYRIIDKLTDFPLLRPVTKWDMIVKARK